MNTESILRGVSHSAEEATEKARDMSTAAKTSFFDVVERAGRLYATIRNFGLDDALFRVGLQRRRTGLFETSIGFGAGFLVGATTALFIAPMSGRAMRRAIGNRVRDLYSNDEGAGVKDKVEDAIHKVEDKAEDVIRTAKQKVEDAKESVAQKLEDKKAARQGGLS